MKNVIIIIFFLLLAPVICARGAELLVPSQYPTIQSAIDAAVGGDTVIVAPGTYTGPGNRNIDFLGKAITVRSQNGPQNCIIDCNYAGRAFYFDNAEEANSILDGITITKGIFWSNSSGIYCEASSPTISRCIITDNFGIGILCHYGSPTISRCIIIGNSDSGIFCWNSNAVIADCTITGNSAGGGRGGGIYCYSSSSTITGCVIIGNTARNGGGIYGCNGPITNCTIAGNLVAGCSSSGGGLAFCDGPITNCTIVNNSSEYYGGGLTVGREPFSPIKNCIIWNNWPDQIYGDYIPVAITYSDVQGGYPGLGNINADPYFVDADANDYHLKSEGWSWDTRCSCWTYDDVTSRCVDAGNPGSPLGDELLAVPRDPENIWGQNLRINMGAFGGTAEASIPPYDWALLSDATNDGISDFIDLDILSSLWLDAGEQLYADFNRDGIIDLFDFALLAQDWLKQTTWYE